MVEGTDPDVLSRPTARKHGVIAMWRGLVFIAAMGLLLPPSALAQEAAESAKPLKLQKYLRLHVTGGRIEVCQQEIGQSRTVTAGQPESPYRQHLQLQVRPPCVVVQYEAIDPQGQLTLRLCERQKLVIERVSSDPASLPTVRYEQPQTGPVKLTVTGESSREFAAPSLWHLLLSDADAGGRHLIPMLELLSPDWGLANQADQIARELVTAAAEADVAADESAWQRLVDDLASDRFGRRQSADESLRDGGQAAAAFLARLDRRSLAAEQRQRIDRICRSFADGTTDTPQRVATWLLGDRSVWLTLLAHEQVELRSAAAEHLSRLTGRPIAFDPHGDEKTRQMQIAELTRRLGVKK